MENATVSSFKFESFKIVKSYFEMSDTEEGLSFSIGFEPIGRINSEKSTFELELGVLIEDENKMFKVEIQSIGIFTFNSSIEPTILDNFFYVNAPAILFPYIRAYISTLTSLSGLKPIVLPTLNLSNLGSELKSKTVNI